MIRILRRFFRKELPQEPSVLVVAREDAPIVFARAFSSDDGQKVLSYLRATIHARVGGPDSSEAALRYADGQRALLQTIQNLVDQGRK